jgi:hypothetical protein
LIESFLSGNIKFILFSLSYIDEDEEDDLVPDMIGLEGASLPPDRTTFLPLPLATKVAQVIPPYRSVSHFIFFSVLRIHYRYCQRYRKDLDSNPSIIKQKIFFICWLLEIQ